MKFRVIERKIMTGFNTYFVQEKKWFMWRTCKIYSEHHMDFVTATFGNIDLAKEFINNRLYKANEKVVFVSGVKNDNL